MLRPAASPTSQNSAPTPLPQDDLVASMRVCLEAEKADNLFWCKVDISTCPSPWSNPGTSCRGTSNSHHFSLGLSYKLRPPSRNDCKQRTSQEKRRLEGEWNRKAGAADQPTGPKWMQPWMHMRVQPTDWAPERSWAAPERAPPAANGCKDKSNHIALEPESGASALLIMLCNSDTECLSSDTLRRRLTSRTRY